MKKLFFTLTLSVFAAFIFAQDVVWGISTGNVVSKLGSVNSSTGAGLDTRSSNFSSYLGSAALGINKNGDWLYYIPYGSGAGGAGDGELNIRSIKNDGNGDWFTGNELTLDMNGGSNNTELGFVRLGIDGNNRGWIVASTQSSPLGVYLGKFEATAGGNANGGAALGTLSFSNFSPGSDDFSNGDLALDNNGNLYVLANNGSTGNTRLFQIKKADLDAAVAAGSVSHITPIKFISNVVVSGGGSLIGNANGLAFSSTGSLYVSTGSKMYFVNASSWNPGMGTVTMTEIGNNSWDIADLATNYTPQTPLPVNFGDINATSKNGQLSVQWQSLNEVNSTGYIVEASKDGNNWVPIGTVQSLASNGNSSGTLDYSFSTATLPISLAGLSIAFLLGAIFKSRIVRLAIAIVVVGTIFSCSKNMNDQVSANKFENLYIRVSSKDINQQINYSKIVKVQNL
jgi:hypothetical protein